MADRLQTLLSTLWPPIRDILLFFAGLILSVHEVLTAGVERPIILGFLGAMMGLPLFLRADERGKK